jgi:hypothetical protein
LPTCSRLTLSSSRATLISEVRKLKQEPAQGIVIMGSGTIVSQLAMTHLIDEFQMVVIPIVLGSGRTLSGVMYLLGSDQVVEGFAHMGYPQHLRIALGIAKLAGAIILFVPGLPLVKEWTYACFVFAWVLAAMGALFGGRRHIINHTGGPAGHHDRVLLDQTAALSPCTDSRFGVNIR